MENLQLFFPISTYNISVKHLLVFLFILFNSFLFLNSIKAQSIQGRLIDAADQIPIAGVNIYFSNYSGGTFSDDSGHFELLLKKQRPLQLVILHVNYENKYIDISFSFKHPENWIIELTPQVRNLDEVVISSEKDKEWKKNIRKFTDAFIGKTENAKKCKIQNPYVINFITNKDALLAHSNELIILENNATGYKIFFLLENFRMQGENISFSGKPYFETLITNKNKDQQNWNKNRERTYLGSTRHFLKTLIEGTSIKEGFEIYYGRVDGNGNFLKRGFMIPSDLIKKENESYSFITNEMLQIVYTKETARSSEESRGSVIGDNGGTNQHELSRLSREQTHSKGKGQVSYLFGKKAKLNISKNGLLERPDLIQVFGYWAEEGVADLLPFDYPIAD